MAFGGDLRAEAKFRESVSSIFRFKLVIQQQQILDVPVVQHRRNNHQKTSPTS